MKKVLLIAAVAGLATTSCKKSYNCVCTSTYNGVSSVTTVNAKTTKKDAQAWCDAVPKASTTVGGQTATSSNPPSCVVQ